MRVDWEGLTATGPFDVAVIDPPWDHYDNAPNRWTYAAKYYQLLKDEDLFALPVKRLLARPSVLFLWCTSPTLARAVECIRAWDLHYRGVAFVWVKTRKDGRPVGAQGIRPSIVKPVTELVLAASTHAKGRPLRLSSERIQQTVFAPRARHSEKPDEVQSRIEEMYPTARKLEMFARRTRPGWTCWGNEVSSGDTGPVSSEARSAISDQRDTESAPI